MTNTNLKLIETYYNEDKTKVKERYYIDENGLRQGMYESFYENGNNGIGIFDKPVIIMRQVNFYF